MARRALAEQGALDPMRGPDSNTQLNEEPMTMSCGIRPFILPLAAIAVLAVTIVAYSQQDAVRNLFGPPSVELREAYEQKSEGIAFDHSQFDALLKKHVSTGGWVDYEGLGRDEKMLDAKEKGIPVHTITVEMRDVDRAILDGETDGFLKVQLKRGTDKMLGATLVARHAGEMISEITLAMVAGKALGTIARTIHPYPTQAKIIRKVGDAHNRTRLTPLVRKLFNMILRWRR